MNAVHTSKQTSSSPSTKSKVKAIREAISANEWELAITLIQQVEAEGYPRSLVSSLSDGIPIKHKPGNRSRQYSPIHENHTGNLGIINQTPFVSIIIVSYNSAEDLKEAIQSIHCQSYKKFEVILVDNGSDGAGELVKTLDPNAKIVKSENNGFAEANNIGLEHAEGELILLLNPDACLEKDCIKNMVHALRLDQTAAAVAPKIYFYKPFLKISIKSNNQQKFYLDWVQIQAQLDYSKIFLLSGEYSNNQIVSNTKGEVLLELSVAETKQELQLSLESMDSIKKGLSFELKFIGSGSRPTIVKATQQKKQLVTLNISSDDHSSSRYLINNAGSGLRECGSPFDIGFGQEDHGQFSQKSYVQALCGCCTLLRRDLFIKRKIFISEFFAYYEDSELSHWINSNGLKILYNPGSIVYHKHSTSTEEKSQLWNLLVKRSKFIYDSITRDPSKIIGCPPDDLKKLKQSLQPKYQALLETLEKYDNTLAKKSGEQLAIGERATIGIYNSYWNTMGGGEKHALDFAVKALSKRNCHVFLISEHDFDVKELSNKFGLNLAGAIKIVCGTVTTSFTERFDIFFNCTYLSSLASRAFVSYYVVSFPQRKLANDLRDCYTFLHNSPYTARWAHLFWGNHSSKIILPIQSVFPEVNDRDSVGTGSTKIMLSVGRFNYSGHCKNQHKIVNAFIRATKAWPALKEWRLLLIGACNLNEVSSRDHLMDCLESAKGHKIDISANASREDVLNAYRQASVYIHAAGLDVNPDENPEKCEHFGIAVFEALVYGCLPVVHKSGGPHEQCFNLPNAYFFENSDELIDGIVKAANAIEAGDSEAIFQESQERAKKLYVKSALASNSLITVS